MRAGALDRPFSTKAITVAVAATAAVAKRT